MKEIEVIKKLYSHNDFPEDDCYLWGNHLITTDSISENTHFTHAWSSPQDIAIKLVEVNVSDISASGGQPEFCFLNLGLSARSSNEKWLSSFIESFQAKLKEYSIVLAGGDTFASDTTNLTLTLFGKVDKYLPRTAGKTGDNLYITGELGYSLLGYKLLSKEIYLENKEIYQLAVQKHLAPTCRLHLSQKLRNQYNIHAMMDITDGLVQDSEKLANASKVSLKIQMDSIQKKSSLLDFVSIEDILVSGEELELLFLSPDEIPEQEGVIKIGNAVERQYKSVVFWYQGKEYISKKLGYEHF